MPMLSIPRLATPLLAGLLVAAALGCGSETDTGKTGVPQIRAMRFAGADLEFALERIAAEAGMPLALDQIRPEDNTPDLALYRVDVDLPAGPLDVALRKLQEVAGAISFELVNGVIYVRSNLLTTTKTPIDLPLIPKASFKGNLSAVATLIRDSIPKSYIVVELVTGDPESPVVEFEVADKASVKDVLLQYASAAKLGWTMYRAGNVVKDTEHGISIVGTTIQARYPRTSLSRRPRGYNLMSTTGALATESARLGVPMLVLDRSVVLNTRGFLNLSSQNASGYPLVETIDDLAQSGWGEDRWHFKWKMDGDVPVIESRDFLNRLAGRDLLRAELLSGEFEGSLAELARWFNTHMKKTTTDVFMGGEIAEGQKRGKFTVAPGTTVQQALVAFAKASGVSPYVVLLGNYNPLSGKLIAHPNAWQGAYLQDLSEWTPTKEELKRASGVYLDEE